MACKIRRAPKWSLLLLSSLIFFTTQIFTFEAAAQQPTSGGNLFQGLQFELSSTRSTSPLFELFSFQEKDSEILCKYNTRSLFGLGEEFSCRLGCEYTEEMGLMSTLASFQISTPRGPFGRLFCEGSCESDFQSERSLDLNLKFAHEITLRDAFDVRGNGFLDILGACGIQTGFVYRDESIFSDDSDRIYGFNGFIDLVLSF